MYSYSLQQQRQQNHIDNYYNQQRLNTRDVGEFLESKSNFKIWLEANEIQSVAHIRTKQTGKKLILQFVQADGAVKPIDRSAIPFDTDVIFTVES